MIMFFKDSAKNCKEALMRDDRNDIVYEEKIRLGKKLYKEYKLDNENAFLKTS